MVLGIGLFVSACAETQLAVHTVKTIAEPDPSAQTEKSSGTYKVGKPYQINGVWYHPKEDPLYDEVGLASWYGEDFHGKTTANGEVYDMNALTAAHKTLPMPSKVRVTNLDNGRSLILTVNDRGPFVAGRIIDLSRRSAQLLGFQRQGLATVRVQAVSEENGIFVAARPPTPDEQKTIASAPRQSVSVSDIDAPQGVAAAAPAPEPRRPIQSQQIAAAPQPVFVQAGAFREAENARRLSRELTRFGTVQIVAIERSGQPMFRVRVGPLRGAEAADDTMKEMIDAGYSDVRLVLE